MSSENVIQSIRSAFAKVVYPGDSWIVSGSNDYEADEVHRNFVGRHWESFTRQELLDNYTALFFFTPQAFHYYLPAYLIASMDQLCYGDALANATMYSLSPHEGIHEEMESQFFLERINLLDIHQFDATTDTIKYILETFPEYFFEDAGRKLSDFWHLRSDQRVK